jgi:hypothetical protein
MFSGIKQERGRKRLVFKMLDLHRRKRLIFPKAFLHSSVANEFLEETSNSEVLYGGRDTGKPKAIVSWYSIVFVYGRCVAPSSTHASCFCTNAFAFYLISAPPDLLPRSKSFLFNRNSKHSFWISFFRITSRLHSHRPTVWFVRMPARPTLSL